MKTRMTNTRTTKPKIFDEDERTLCAVCGKADDCDCDTTPQDTQQKCIDTSLALHCNNNSLDTPISMITLRLYFLNTK